MKNKVSFFVIAMSIFASQHELSAQFGISAQLRPRAEYRNGYRQPLANGGKAAFFVSQRTRLTLSYANEKVKLLVSPQDVRVWGDESQLGNLPRIGLHEAWAELKLGSQWGLKTGRQELVYENQRLLGNVGWAQQARSHDALLLKFGANDLKLDIGGAFNQVQENLSGTHYRTDNYKAMIFAYAGKKLANIKAHALFINDAAERSDTSTDLSWKHTMGGGAVLAKGKFSMSAAAYWQGGKTKAEQKISAFLTEVELKANFEPITVSLGADIVSGTKAGSDKYGAFNTLFATNHKFYGFMDYFINIPDDTGGGGLQDYHLQLSYSPKPKLSIQLDYHHFLTVTAVPNTIISIENISKNLGGELDAVFSHNINPYIKLNVGASAYFPTLGMKQIKGGDTDRLNTWAWTMLTITPELFNSGKHKEND